MFIKYDNNSVRLTGRWYKNGNAATATACGSKIEFSFYGNTAVMHFDMTFSEHPYPHVWIQTDGGAKIEAILESYMRICAEGDGMHTVMVIYKSAVEMQHRWYEPLICKIAFKGFEADKPGELKPNNKKYIEFIVDSITEGVLVDEQYRINSDNDQLNRPFQYDDLGQPCTIIVGSDVAEDENGEYIIAGAFINLKEGSANVVFNTENKILDEATITF